MADNKDELEARRWFRQRLGGLGTQYPELKESEHQKRLREALKEEGTLCRENRQGEDEEGH